jgi:hypothetical protein
MCRYLNGSSRLLPLLPIRRMMTTCWITLQISALRNNVRKVKCTLVQALSLCTGRTAHRGSRGIAVLSLDHGTRRGEGLASRPGRSLTPGKTQYPLCRKLGGSQGRSGQVRKNSPPPGFDPRTVQPVASRYTDYATRPTRNNVPTAVVTNNMQESSSWETSSPSATQEISRVLWNPEVNCWIHESPLSIRNVNHINAVHALSHFLKIDLYIIFPSTSTCSKLSLSL